MANIKNITTILSTLNEVSDEALEAIISNDMVEVEELKPTQKLCVLVYDALTKGINTSKYQLVLDCNFPASKFHSHDDPAEDVYKVDYYRVVATSAPSVSLMQIYPKPSRDASGIKFSVCTSAKKFVREQIAAMEDGLGFRVPIDTKTGRAKTSCRDNISYDDIVSVVKTVLAVLSDSAKKEEQKAPKSAAKKKKSEAKTEEEIISELTALLSEETEEEAV